ncbi:hypothetical protein HB364_26715 [Pseudoflavitalea sp. X16]|uniref:hypothetical protein n=1 Tax=Paraflavitalea devenefica TaxID=2716334 RepID=UPI0014204948|nr:hypothetical protein [Paraflavitalea devenefica]NII28702.1 hypothetical protein [Paraflavitalea devenefica]
MVNVPLYIGVLLIIPIAAQASADNRQQLPNGYGVGAVMRTDIVILHEAIKENIRQQALLIWVDAPGKLPTRHQVLPAIEAIINNIRYVSIENTWYQIIDGVSSTSLLREVTAGAGATVEQNSVRSVMAMQRQGAYHDGFTAPAAGTQFIRPSDKEQCKVVVTVFVHAPDLAGDYNHPQEECQDLAMVVDRYQPLC